MTSPEPSDADRARAANVVFNSDDIPPWECDRIRTLLAQEIAEVRAESLSPRASPAAGEPFLPADLAKARELLCILGLIDKTHEGPLYPSQEKDLADVAGFLEEAAAAEREACAHIAEKAHERLGSEHIGPHKPMTLAIRSMAEIMSINIAAAIRSRGSKP